jgi:hypothetical protein
LDVTFQSRGPGAANTEDVRWESSFAVDEFPWTLRFRFRRVLEPDNRERWALVGLEIGDPASLDDGDQDVELTPERMKILADGFGRYRKLAELYLIPTPDNREQAKRLRSGMGRRRRAKLTDEYLMGLGTEWSARLAAGGTKIDLAQDLGISRKQLRRQLDELERRTLSSE